MFIAIHVRGKEWFLSLKETEVTMLLVIFIVWTSFIAVHSCMPVCLYACMPVWKNSEGGRVVILNTKIYIAKFGPLNRAFSA